MIDDENRDEINDTVKSEDENNGITDVRETGREEDNRAENPVQGTDKQISRCRRCGAEINTNDSFCGNCGLPLNTDFRPQVFNDDSKADMSPTISLGEYILYMFLFSIPIVGFIAMIIFGFVDAEKNRSRANFARAYLILFIVGIIISLVVIFMLASLFSSLTGMWNSRMFF